MKICFNSFQEAPPMTHSRQYFSGGIVSTLKQTGFAMVLVAFQFLLVVHAAPFTAVDEKTVRTVVEAQLAAFAKDDAVKAFSYAAPSVREAVGTADAFLTMVRRDYPMVYRPASVAFLKAEGKDDDVVQRVQMLDASGNSYLAVYSLQRQKGNVWRITGCAVVENKGRMA
jgi:hypothetical protein